MDLGWYRVGAEPADAEGRIVWHFRHGHHTDGAPGQEVRVRAATEVAAMRTLLQHLQREASAREDLGDLRRAGKLRGWGQNGAQPRQRLG